MGKSFFGYQLEGLKRQGSHAVWIPIGVFETTDDLERAKSDSRERENLAEFRSCAYYLDTCGSEQPRRRPGTSPASCFDDTHLLA